MTHIQQSVADKSLWIGLIAIQAILATKKTSFGFLRVFLGGEALIGSLLFPISILAGVWTYFYAWCVGTVLHHALSGFLVFSIFTVIRKRGLPGRQGVIWVYLLGLISLFAGASYANLSNHLLTGTFMRMVLPLDHAFSFTLGCMIAFLPLYALVISATISHPLRLVIVGFAIYELAYSGMIGSWIYDHHRMKHLADLVYLISLFLWSIAFRQAASSQHWYAGSLRSNITSA